MASSGSRLNYVPAPQPALSRSACFALSLTKSNKVFGGTGILKWIHLYRFPGGHSYQDKTQCRAHYQPQGSNWIINLGDWDEETNAVSLAGNCTISLRYGENSEFLWIFVKLTLWFYNNYDRKSSQMWVIYPMFRFTLFIKSQMLRAFNEKENLKEPAANRFAASLHPPGSSVWIAFPSFHLLTRVITQPCLLKFILLHLRLLWRPKLYIREKMKSKTIKSEDYLKDLV